MFARPRSFLPRMRPPRTTALHVAGPCMRTLLLAAALLLIPSASFSQIGDAPRPGSAGAALEIIHPNFRDGSGIRFGTTVMYLSGHAAVTPGTRLVLELPFSRASTKDGFGDGSIIGNPYVGVQFGGQLTSFDAGVRLPLAGDAHSNATVVGVIADIERFEAFLPDVATLRLAVSARTPPGNGVSLGFHASSAVLLNTEEGLAKDADVLLGYGTDVAFHVAAARLGARFSGRWNVTGDGSFASNTLHQLGAFVELGSGRVRPGLQVRVPLDSDMREDVPWIAGLSIQVAL